MHKPRISDTFAQAPAGSRRNFLRLGGAALALSSTATLLNACSPAAQPAPTAAPAAKPTAAAKPAATTAPAAAPAAKSPEAAKPADATAAPAAKPTEAAKPAAAAPAQKPTGSLTVSQPGKLVSLDPHGPQSADRPTITSSRQIFDSLTFRDPASGEIRPALAESWQTPDPQTWVFKLRQNAKFHDGSPVTANDVKGTIERIQALKGPIAPLWADVESVEAPDNTTVRIRTKTPVGTLLTSATLLFVMPASMANESGFFNRPIGSGPFKVANYRPDAELRLDANTDYWGGAPGVQTLLFRDIQETAAKVTALETGEIDFTWGLPPDQLPALRRNNELKIESVPSFAYYFLWFNAKREPFTDKRVRQAMWHALDIDTMIKDLIADIGKRAEAPIPATVFGFAAQTPYRYDPSRARQLLAEAGYPNGFQTFVIWTPGGSPQDRELMAAMVSYWDKVGVRVRSQEMERAAWLKDLLALNWDMDFQTNAVLTGDADYTLRRLYLSSANRTGYANPELDRMLNAAAADVDQNRRKELYAQANKIIWDDAVGIFPADLLENYVFRQRNVGSFVADPAQTPNFARVRIS